MRWRFLLLVLLGAALLLRAEAPLPPLPRAAVAKSVSEGLAYLRQAQHPDGSYGTVQRRLQTALVVLAFLAQGETPEQPGSPIPAALRWLLANSTEEGFLGDEDYPQESHAIVGLALSECVGMVADPALDRQVAQRVAAAYDLTLKQQDKAVGADYYGGWKPNAKAKANDRRTTAWCLLFLRSMQLRGHELNERALDRALDFMEGAQKMPGSGKAFPREDAGGFSYDAAGLPVVSTTGAGLACMALYGRDRARRAAALDWLARNRPLWYGPNFYDAYFFAARGHARERLLGPEQAARAQAFANRLWELLREHQQPDGSFAIPPGNAENTRAMGAPYATAMALLILLADRELLPIDATD
jgi:hypothetical protein